MLVLSADQAASVRIIDLHHLATEGALVGRAHTSSPAKVRRAARFNPFTPISTGNPRARPMPARHAAPSMRVPDSEKV